MDGFAKDARTNILLLGYGKKEVSDEPRYVPGLTILYAEKLEKAQLWLDIINPLERGHNIEQQPSTLFCAVSLNYFFRLPRYFVEKSGHGIFNQLPTHDF